ncbi:MAG: hypothetical protein Q9160_004679 [Pyrenula sp. 1 TL-2023]
MALEGTISSSASLLEGLLQYRQEASRTPTQDHDTPLTKRQKVDSFHSNTELLECEDSDYICLAKASYTVVQKRLTPTDLTTRDDTSSTPVAVKEVQEDRRLLTFRLATKKRKSTQDFIVSFATPLSESILNHIAGLPLRNNVDPKKQPLICTQSEVSYVGSTDVLDSFDLRIKILWQNSGIIPNTVPSRAREIFNTYFGSNTQDEDFEEWTPRHFYDAVNVPKKEDTPEHIRRSLLKCDLYPFQRRAVRWLLNREGVSWTPQGVSPFKKTSDVPLLDLFTESVDADGRRCFVSHALNVATHDLARFEAQQPPVKGGILAEEMGLGKTVEIIALICLHRRVTADAEPETSGPKRCGTTLIITPRSILAQWMEEFKSHAPSLEVYHYKGVRGENLDDDEFSNFLAAQDVVLTTYDTLSREIYFAEESPQRDLRHSKKFVARRSPLVQLSWWRVCLDEAQMVESGVSNSAKVARLIPRENAWAVSGTPLQRDDKDLFGLLLFLRCTPWCQSLQLWDRLLLHARPSFRSLIGEIALRHTKDLVAEDLQLPPQSRNVISVPFTAIEEQHYLELFQQMHEECGLDENGAPVTEDFNHESPTTIEKMRGWLTRLRQTCLHPEVGGRNRRALGRTDGKPLRTVKDVLEVMIEQNDVLMRAEQRSILLSQLRRGQMYENTKSSYDAMELFKDAYENSTAIVKECRAQLDLEIGKSKNEGTSTAGASTSGDNSGDKEESSRAGVCRSRLRSALEVQHIAIFFMGNAYYQLKTKEPCHPKFAEREKGEEAAYQEAKEIRGEMLSEILYKANRYMREVRDKSGSKASVHLPRMTPPSFQSGLENIKILEKLEAFCEALNAQAAQFTEWKMKMVDFLSHALIDEDEGIELRGDEYEASTRHQDEMYVYMEALRALFADRHDAISGQENFLIKHEMQLNLREARAGNGPAPELFIAVLAAREKTKPKKELGSLRSLISELRSLITSLEWREGQGNTRAKSELFIVQSMLQSATKMSTEQTRMISNLEKEVELFRDTMNIRLEYYRQLQIISDTVAPWEEEQFGKRMDWVLFYKKLRDEQLKNNKVAKLQSKRRYLLHLKDESTSSEVRTCTICQSSFEIGTLTVCGHQFCKECIRIWYRDHHTCPVCKIKLSISDFHDVTYKPKELVLVEEKPDGANGSPVGSSPTQGAQSPGDAGQKATIYSDIKASTLNQIKNIEIGGSYFGTKVSMICRHIIWLRQNDPGSKSILFSQYRDFLDVLGKAFYEQKIAFTTIDKPGGIETFKSNPAIECFLLHAKSNSSGLNLTNASHVFLCEPLVNTAIELQAIARVHRIGQQRPTTVWMYIVSDTVEESIYEISVERRLSHIQRNQRDENRGKSRSGTATPAPVRENAIDAANSMELRDTVIAKLVSPGKAGGEIVGSNDLWRCLFGKVRTAHPSVVPERGGGLDNINLLVEAAAVERNM